MKIEEEIIAIEDEAEKTVAEAREEAKRISECVVAENRRIASAAEDRFKAESAGLKKQYEDKLARELGEVNEEGKRELDVIAEMSRKESASLVKKVVESYQRS